MFLQSPPGERRHWRVAWGVHAALLAGAWVYLTRDFPDRPMTSEELSHAVAWLPVAVIPSALLLLGQRRRGKPIVSFITAWLLGLPLGMVTLLLFFHRAL